MVCKNLNVYIGDSEFDCNNKMKCIEYRDSRAKAVCKERDKRYCLVNDKNCKVALYHMDGGVVSNDEDEPRCDYLYIVFDEQCPTAIFAELKGRNCRHALAQLQASINRFGPCLGRRICARVICKSVPRIHNNSDEIKLKRELRKQYNVNLAIFENNKEEIYSDI